MEKQSCRLSGSSGCSAVEARLPYDELRHEIDRNVLSVRVAKNVGRIKSVGGVGGRDEAPCVRARCVDARGNECCSRPGCARLNVIPNKAPPAKQPDEELFLLRTSRQILSAEEMRNSLEIELRTPRNYAPLATSPPSSPASPGKDDQTKEESCTVGAKKAEKRQKRQKRK